MRRRFVMQLFVDAQYNGRNRHRIRIDGVYAVYMFIAAIAVSCAGRIGAGGGQQGGDNLSVVYVDQAARGKNGHHAVLIFKIIRAVQDDLFFGLQACAFAGIQRIQIVLIILIGFFVRLNTAAHASSLLDCDRGR